MPIYEYICRECGHAFEKLVPRAGTPVVCEKCAGSQVEKQFSVFAAAVSSPAKHCAAAESCPAAGGCGCHGKCGCQH